MQTSKPSEIEAEDGAKGGNLQEAEAIASHQGKIWLHKIIIEAEGHFALSFQSGDYILPGQGGLKIDVQTIS